MTLKLYSACTDLSSNLVKIYFRYSCWHYGCAKSPRFCKGTHLDRGIHTSRSKKPVILFVLKRCNPHTPPLIGIYPVGRAHIGGKYIHAAVALVAVGEFRPVSLKVVQLSLAAGCLSAALFKVHKSKETFTGACYFTQKIQGKYILVFYYVHRKEKVVICRPSGVFTYSYTNSGRYTFWLSFYMAGL